MIIYENTLFLVNTHRKYYMTKITIHCVQQTTNDNVKDAQRTNNGESKTLVTQLAKSYVPSVTMYGLCTRMKDRTSTPGNKHSRVYLLY